MNNMRIGITGAFGSVGKALLEELIARGHQIRIFEIKNSKNKNQHYEN